MQSQAFNRLTKKVFYYILLQLVPAGSQQTILRRLARSNLKGRLSNAETILVLTTFLDPATTRAARQKTTAAMLRIAHAKLIRSRKIATTQSTTCRSCMTFEATHCCALCSKPCHCLGCEPQCEPCEPQC